MKKLIAIAFFCGSIVTTNGQDRQSNLSLGFNFGRIQIQETALNGLIHQGSIIIVNLSYDNQSQSGLSHSIELNFGTGSIRSDIEESKNSTFSNPQLRYSLTKSISPSISVGGYLSGEYLVINFENWDDSHKYWVTSYQLGPVLKLNNVPLNDFSIEFSFPILAFVSRSRNEITNKVDSGTFSDIWGLIHSNATTTSFIKYQSLYLQLRYTLFNSERINLDIRSKFKYVHSLIPGTKEFTSSIILIGLLFSYGIN